MKLLAVGDIHLGRRPTRLPEELSHTPAELGPAAAWRLTVEFAVNENVDAVLLAGDVVESEKDFFEAFHELRQGVDKLTEAGIQVIAVAGNHDVHVLPRLADLLQENASFKLLGRGGTWESIPIQANGETLLLWGWSFPQREVRSSPLAGTQFDSGSGLQLGLLHCDLDQRNSPYAPVMSSELNRAGLSGWLLGHIHKPAALSPDAMCGYLGCLSGMDPGESGTRGPWSLHIEKGRVREVIQVPLAPLRWLALDLDISDLEDIGDLDSRLVEEITNLDEKLSRENFKPKAVGIRLTLVGRTLVAKELADWIQDKAIRAVHVLRPGTDYFVEHCASAVLPKVDLEELARQHTPLGLLARRLLLLDSSDENPERRALIADATDAFGKSLQKPIWRVLESNAEMLEEAQVVARLKHAGTQAINQLYAQQRGIAE